MVCNLKNHEVLTFKNKVFDGVFRLEERDYLACYKLIVESFEHNPDMCIPSYEDWLLTRTSEQSLSFVYKIQNKVTGFLSITDHAHSGYGEIRTLGVLPGYRSKGIGKILLCYGLNYFACQNYQRCYLTVATQNKNALSIYQNLGFLITKHFEVYCWKKLE
jgi:ribosomal protein S18 acetylase RimI-like enzyme